MKGVIEEIIRKKPHLSDPFRFYEKTLKFAAAVKQFCLVASQADTAYAPEVVEKVFEQFSLSLELPESILSPLKQAMLLREIDFTRLPMGEIPAFSLPYPEDDLAILLYLLSKPYFFAFREAYPLDGRKWDEGRCPVCNAQPTISWVAEGRRQVSCSFCGTSGYVNQSGCPICLAEDKAKQRVFVFETEESFKINTCDLCRSYVKTVDAHVCSSLSPEVADLMSLPLDIVVQEKGYSRRSPNPIGMRNITTQG